MNNPLRKLLNNLYLKNSELKWELYNHKVKINIYWLFAFIDQFQTGGHFNGQISSDNKKTECNSVVVINLNKRTVDEKVIIHNISHESLHVAICNCLKVQCSDFVEEVIDNWILGQAVYCNGWDGNLYILKAKKNERTHKELHGIK